MYTALVTIVPSIQNTNNELDKIHDKVKELRLSKEIMVPGLLGLTKVDGLNDLNLSYGGVWNTDRGRYECILTHPMDRRTFDSLLVKGWKLQVKVVEQTEKIGDWREATGFNRYNAPEFP